MLIVSHVATSLILLSGGLDSATALAAASRIALTVNELGAALPFFFLGRRKAVVEQHG